LWQKNTFRSALNLLQFPLHRILDFHQVVFKDKHVADQKVENFRPLNLPVEIDIGQ
jgi:hypothetical protein